MKHHKLKIKPEYLTEIFLGNKTFEIRLNDRDYKVGDEVTLTEIPVGDIYTPRSFTAKIGYITNFEQKPGYVVFSLMTGKPPEQAPEPDPLINRPACTWKHDDDEGSWDAECGERWSITEGTPEENNFRFCPGCGKTIKTIYSNRTEVNDE